MIDEIVQYLEIYCGETEQYFGLHPATHLIVYG